MKKIIVFSSLALAMASCNRSHMCECTYVDSYGNTVSGSRSNLDGSKKKTKAACESKSSDWAPVNGKCAIND